MKRQLFISLLLLFSIVMAAQDSNPKYGDDWKKVEAFEEDDLPQSASKEVTKILKKAIADKNTTQVVKVLLYQEKYRLRVDNEDRGGLIAELEKLVSDKKSNVPEKALMHSMLATLYSEYYNSGVNDTGTELGDAVPKDMKEWTPNIFIKKMIENTDLSVKDAETLKKHTTKEYSDLIDLGSDSPAYYPTLYDFLMKRAIDIGKQIKTLRYDGTSEISTTGHTPKQLNVLSDDFVNLNIEEGKDRTNIAFIYYQQYFRDLQRRNMSSTIVLTELDKLDFVKSLSYRYRQEAELAETYEVLYNKYAENEISLKIIEAIVVPMRYDDKKHPEAYNWCRKGIDKFPNSRLADGLKNQLRIIEKPGINLGVDDLIYPQTPTQIKITHKNVQVMENKPAFRLYKIDGEKKTTVKEYSPTLISAKTYVKDTLDLDLGKLAPAKYEFEYINEKKEEWLKKGETTSTMTPEELEEYKYSEYAYQNNSVLFTVSSIASFTRGKANNMYEVYVVDYQSGKPIKDATVLVKQMHNEKETETTLTTNEHGLALFEDKIKTDDYRYFIGEYFVTYGDDAALNNGNLYMSRSYNSGNTNQSDITSLFLDRNIYRPGQTVFFKAITLNEDNKPIVGKRTKIELRNPNGEVVADKTIVSNEFGSVAGEFVLPQSGLLGQYYIDVDSQSETYFSVEEYKRPTFEITFDKLKGTYAFEEEVKLKGMAKNFSGINIQNANVEYRITRQEQSIYGYGRSNDEHFDEGVVKTNADGTFEIIFVPKAKDKADNISVRGGRNAYSFNIAASITDLNGETQTANYKVTVSDVSMMIGIEIARQIEKNDDSKIKISTKNFDNETIDTNGKYSLHTLDKNNATVAEVLNGTFKTGEQEALRTKLKQMPSGKYQLQVKALDSKGKEVDAKQDFVLYSYNDKKPPLEQNGWLVQKNVVFGKNKPAEIIFGVSDKDVHVLYQLYNNDKTFESGFVKLSEINKLFSVAYKAEYGDKLNAAFTFVKDGKFSNQNVTMTVEKKKEDIELTTSLEVFRDKLRPGQEETWTIKILDSKGKPVMAEVLASMYDMSLDNIMKSSAWGLSRIYTPELYISPLSYNYMRAKGYASNNYLNLNYTDDNYNSGDHLWFDQINWYQYWGERGISISISDVKGSDKQYGIDVAELGESKVVNSGMSVARPAPPMAAAIKGKVAGIEAVPVDALAEEDAMSAAGSAGYAPQPQIRSNFNETAFFYPILKTNEKGETLISFTVPESNTKWKFRTLAHDKDARSGSMETTVVTQKELMVTPNMPRFVRQGDKTSISTKISNLSENAINGNATIEFFDPLTDQPIDLKIVNQDQAFEAKEGASASVSWTFDVPKDMELIGCRIVAKNATFSDGEQHVLSVLSNRMLVTETMPVNVNKAGETSFRFDKLADNKSQSLDNYRFTVEFAGNPAWYAIQALPTMSNPSNENAVNWFASYYTNALGTSIIRQYPKVTAMISAWNKVGGSKETLMSKLQKDEELKNVLLEETPWVLEAKTEAEQMQRLTLLFDMNNAKQLQENATAKLVELQTDEGAWAWYKGMYPSRSITQYILYGYGELQTTGSVEYPSAVKEMQMNALRYVDNKILEDYNNLKKNNKDWKKTSSLYTSQLEYLFVRSYYRDIPISQESREAERFYTDVAGKNWKSLNIYERSILSRLLTRNGEKALAGKIAQSLREYAKTDNELGMYWPKNRNSVFVSMSAVSTHTFLMKALKENGASDAEMDLMKQWLLNQKKTQQWESTHATVDAVNALLSTGSDWFASEGTTTIKVAGKVLEPETKELGTGYFKQAWNKSEVTSAMSKIDVSRVDNKPGFGSAYWQYYEDLDKITAQDGELNINKQLYKEVVSSTGKSLVQITSQNPLTVGDKVVVRLTVRTDRDMEFVHLKDMRASCFEPIDKLSGTKWQKSTVYYQTTKDASTNYYFDNLPKGIYILEYPVYVTRTGKYANGITTIQCQYAPEYTSHTAGETVIVE